MHDSSWFNAWVNAWCIMNPCSPSLKNEVTFSSYDYLILSGSAVYEPQLRVKLWIKQRRQIIWKPVRWARFSQISVFGQPLWKQNNTWFFCSSAKPNVAQQREYQLEGVTQPIDMTVSWVQGIFFLKNGNTFGELLHKIYSKVKTGAYGNKTTEILH